MSQDSILLSKSMEFAVRIVNLNKYLQSEKKEFVMSKQLLRSGTSIGANIREAIYAQSTCDFVSKLSISMKETSETEYWLELLSRTGYLSEQEHQSIKDDCSEIAKILTATLKSKKKNI